MSKAKTLITSVLAAADIKTDGSRPWDLHIHKECFYADVFAGGSLAFGESYMDGVWDCEALDVMFMRLTAAGVEQRLRSWRLLPAYVQAKLFNLQSVNRSRRVAELHYDLGNEFYRDMLDPYMQYTCAYYKDTDDLNRAQEQKLELICRKLQLREGERVLELGGGWGGFARYAAENYGCKVESYNISTQQVQFAREACRGLPVTIHHKDYREASGEFDKAVSIGICEHIGLKNHRAFLALQKARIRPDGLILLHTIGCNRSKTTSDRWFTKYIFPGGFLPSLAQLSKAADNLLVTEDVHNIGASYDLTLMAWHRRFEEAWPRYREQFGERFKRMWRYYLLACAGAFRARQLQLWQVVYSPQGVKGGYESVR